MTGTGLFGLLDNFGSGDWSPSFWSPSSSSDPTGSPRWLAAWAD